jgi:hypothetical protein
MGNPIPPIEQYSITDPRITHHLKREIEFVSYNLAPVLNIEDFPNEAGFFMIWELSVAEDEQARRFLPIFINDEFVLRPLAGKKIWDAILDERKVLIVDDNMQLPNDVFAELTQASREHAYDTFIALKEETEKRREELHRKYMYALKLRIEAAEHIGIENIKKHKLARLAAEKADAEKAYLASKTLFPEFRPLLFVRMEGGNA